MKLIAHRSLFLLLLIFIFSLAAYSQNQTESRETPGSTKRSDPPLLGSPTEEMMDRAHIRREEEAHKENLARAKEGAEIGASLLSSFETNKTLARDDLKKLERLEKIARKIRSQAGGSDDDEPLENPPRELGPAIEQLAELSEELRHNVEKTSRMVVSASVIECSNKLIELIRHIRNFTP